jgi:hypothetical protein
MTSPVRKISLADWKRAIFIDFEGRVKDPPSLLGHACDSVWSVYVIEPELWSAARHGHARGRVVAESIQVALTELRNRAEREKRLIVAWSMREIDAIKETQGLTSDDYKWWENHLLDAKKFAKPMARQLKIDIRPRISSSSGKENRNPLASYMDAVNYKVPSLHGPNNAAQRILYVRKQILAKGSFEMITPTAKKKWANGLSHNYHDCIGLSVVMTSLSQQIEQL